MNPQVDQYLRGAKNWRSEMEKLRMIMLDCGLTEALKWGKPCYLFQQKNIVVIQGFKAYCALLFLKGFLLDDPQGILVKTGPNTRVGRQIRFTGVGEIARMKALLKSYVYQAIELEKAGLKVKPKKTAAAGMPGELKKKLAETPTLKAAFAALTPGRQRAYIFYFSAPKQSQTRLSRIEKSTGQILRGRGLNELG